MTRVAVVGAGVMGANHARVLRTLPGAELVLVVDPDRERARLLAESVGAGHAAGPDALLGLVDAAVVASPSETHADIGVPLLEAGVDLLVEKPIATSTADAARLVAAARAGDRVLMTGHVERFNAAVVELLRRVADPVHLQLTRVGPFSPRVTADVVLDLMVHDLDLALAITGSDVEAVQAMGQTVRTDSLDLVTAQLRFRNGMTAALTASRVGQAKVRQVELTQRADTVVADLVRQDLTVHRVDHNEFTSEGGRRYRQSGLMEIPFLDQRGEPLALELGHFLECVTTRATPRVTGEDGLRALELALAVREAAAPAAGRAPALDGLPPLPRREPAALTPTGGPGARDDAGSR